MTFLAIDDQAARSLRTMPVCVRRKLAESGVELAEDQWAGLPMAARRRMVDMRVDAAVERRSFASLVRWLCGTFLQDGTALKLGAGPRPWRDSEPPVGEGIPAEQWRSLSIDGRFAVLQAPHGDARHALLRALTKGTMSD